MHVIRPRARLASALFVATVALVVGACATSVDDPIGSDLFEPGGADAATDARGLVDGGRTLPGNDSGATGTPPPVKVDAGGATDAASTVDAAPPPPPPPPPVDAAPPVGGACPSANGKYTIAYLIAVAALPDGGSLPPCPCPSTQCCYTPLGASSVCLPL